MIKEVIINILSDRDKLTAFISGDTVSTILMVIGIGEIDWIHPLFKLALIAVGGFVGGYFGLLAKDFHNWTKKKLK